MERRDKSNKRASLKSNYRKNMKIVRENCNIYLKEAFNFVRSLKPYKYNCNIVDEESYIINGNGIWEKELNKTIKSSFLLKKLSLELGINPQDVSKKTKRDEDKRNKTKKVRKRN